MNIHNLVATRRHAYSLRLSEWLNWQKRWHFVAVCWQALVLLFSPSITPLLQYPFHELISPFYIDRQYHWVTDFRTVSCSFDARVNFQLLYCVVSLVGRACPPTNI